MKISTETFSDGTKVEINVDSSGDFWATVDGIVYSKKTKAELIEQLRKVVKAISREPIPVTVVGPSDDIRESVGLPKRSDDKSPAVVDAVLRSKHEREHNAFLFQAANGKKFKMSSSYHGKVCHRLSDVEKGAYIQLAEELAKAQTNLDAWLKEHQIDPERALLDKSIERAEAEYSNKG